MEYKNNIKAIREAKGFTQEELAYRSCVSLDLIRQIESGEIELGEQSIVIALKFAKVLGVTVEEML